MRHARSQLGTMMKNENDFAVMGEFVDKVVQFSTNVSDISSTLNQDLVTHLLTPLDGCVRKGGGACVRFLKRAIDATYVQRHRRRFS